MSKKQTIQKWTLATLFFISAAFVVLPQNAIADCGGAPTTIINCDQDNTDKNGDGKVSSEETGIWGLLIMAINILTAGIGVAALGGLVYGAILYTSAGGNPEQVKKARTIFTNIVIGIIAFAAMWGLLNFLIPGGVF